MKSDQSLWASVRKSRRPSTLANSPASSTREIFPHLCVAFGLLSFLAWGGCRRDSTPVSPLPPTPADTADAAFRSYIRCRLSIDGIVLHERKIRHAAGPRRDTTYFARALHIDTTLAFTRDNPYTLIHDSSKWLRTDRDDSLRRSLRMIISADSLTRTLDSVDWQLRTQHVLHGFDYYQATRDWIIFMRHITPDPNTPSNYVLTDRVKIGNLCRSLEFEYHALRRTFSGFGDFEEWEETLSAEVTTGAEVRLTFLR